MDASKQVLRATKTEAGTGECHLYEGASIAFTVSFANSISPEVVRWGTILAFDCVSSMIIQVPFIAQLKSSVPDCTPCIKLCPFSILWWFSAASVTMKLISVLLTLSPSRLTASISFSSFTTAQSPARCVFGNVWPWSRWGHTDVICFWNCLTKLVCFYQWSRWILVSLITSLSAFERQKCWLFGCSEC